MRGCLFVLGGLVLGVILGGGLGVLIGSACVEIFKVSTFEGGAGMLVFFTFMPSGAIAGGITGAIVLGKIGSKAPAAAAEPDKQQETRPN
jgi:hypothetical protein